MTGYSALLSHLYDANNKAAASIKQGDYQDAFQEALAAVHGVSMAMPGEEMEHDSHDSQDPHFVYVQPLFGSTTSQKEDEHKAYDNIFAFPFHMTPLYQEKSPLRVHVKVVSAVTIFNMGLACHLQSLQDTEDRLTSNMLAFGASRLYENASELLQDHTYMTQQQEEEEPEPDEFLLQVHLAVCSNMLQVCLNHGNLDLVSVWKGKLHRLLQEVPNQDGTSPLVKYFGRVQDMYAGDFQACRAA